jgi:hypothetical protein
MRYSKSTVEDPYLCYSHTQPGHEPSIFGPLRSPQKFGHVQHKFRIDIRIDPVLAALTCINPL